MNAFSRWLVRLLLALAPLLALPAAAADWNSSAQAPDRGKGAQAGTFRLAPGQASLRRIALGEADAGEIAAVRSANATTKRLQIGIGRDLPETPDRSSASLQWAPVDGGVAAQWEITSAGAHALRVELEASRLPAGAEIRAAGAASPGTVYGPFTATEIPVGQGTWWSPVLEGDSAVVEVFLPAGAAATDASVSLARLSHLFASPAERNVDLLAKDGSQACEVDIICRSQSDAALAQVGRAVARMTFSDGAGGGTFLCTGTLLNPIGGSFTPYFYTAAHCMQTQAAASTLTTHWFYDRTNCGSGTTSPSYVQVSGGAALLYVNETTDVLFLRLNQSPPSGAVFAGWDSSTMGVGVALTAVHHPAGDWKKVSLGTMGGFSAYGGGSGDDHVIALWNSTATGVTEGGSSGSGIFTFNGTGYQLRGGLHGGPSSCTATGTDLRDYYSRFDRAYAFLSQYLNPGTSCSYTLSPTSTSVGSGSSSGSFSVTTSSGCTWSATSNASWLTTSSTGSGSGSVQYSVAANTGAARSGAISVGGQTFTVSQQAGQTGTTVSVIANGGFESGGSSWTQTATGGAAIITSGSTAHSGSGYAWLGGYVSGTDSIYQDMTIPAGASQVTLRYWYNIFTNETVPGVWDTLQVVIQNPATGATIATVASYSNQNATSGWLQSPSFDLSAFAGQSIRLRFTATNDFSSFTNFFLDDITLTAVTSSSGTANYTALWWNPAESGWGINFNHQGNIVFGTLFTYDSTGAPLWLVMSAGNLQSGTTYSGVLYRTTGPAFNANPFTPITAANLTQVGTMTVTFSGSDAATLNYTVNGVSVTKSIQRQVYGSRAATCTPTTASRASLTNYQDLWWNPNESGWGVNITHQDNILFATLFTYSSTGRDLWLVMSAGQRQPDGSYLGTLYQTSGPPFNANPFTPIGAGNLTTVGTMRFQFTDGVTGTLTYTVNGIQVTKSITRQVFSSPVPACS